MRFSYKQSHHRLKFIQTLAQCPCDNVKGSFSCELIQAIFHDFCPKGSFYCVFEIMVELKCFYDHQEDFSYHVIFIL